MGGSCRQIVVYVFSVHWVFSPPRKKEHTLKLLGPDILRWGGGFPREGVGVKKFDLSLEAQGSPKKFGGISRVFCRYISGVPEKFEKKTPHLSEWYNLGLEMCRSRGK